MFTLIGCDVTKTIDVPGKAILFGEHFVVHGARALAHGVHPGVTATWQPAAEGHHLYIPQWNLHADADHHGDDLQQAFAAMLLALSKSPLQHNIPPLTVQAHIHLPSGSGLGSSAALGIATLIACEQAGEFTLSNEERVRVGFSWEKIFHGNPSGFDHATAIYGGLVSYQRHAPQALTTHPCDQALRLVIAQVEPGASTRAMVEGVARWATANTNAFATLLNEADKRVDDALDAIRRHDLATVGHLMNDNHKALQTIGVSTEKLDRAVKIARENHAFGAKLTGAGGGGCMIALVNEERAPQVAAALSPHALRVLQTHIEGAPAT